MNAPEKHKTEDAFHKLIHYHSIYGPWAIASQMTPHPLPDAVPHIWKAALLESLVQQSATAVPVGDERRAMQLFNPGLKGAWATTSTLIAAVQVLLPGEIARSHRHSPSAIRFIMRGDGAYTAVEGEKVIMREGDLVLTPNWQWHDHGNETDHMVVWMDGLDVPLTRRSTPCSSACTKRSSIPTTSRTTARRPSTAMDGSRPRGSRRARSTRR